MVKLCLMASHGYPPGLGAVFHPDHVLNRGLKDTHHFIHYQGSNQDVVNSHPFTINLQRKEEWSSTGGLFDCNHFLRIDSNSMRPALIDFQETDPDSVRFSFGIAEQCTRQERISKLLMYGSIEEEDDDSMDLTTPYDMIWPQHLIYPNKEVYYDEPLLDLVGDRSYSTFHPDGQLQYDCSGIEIKDMLSVMPDFYQSKNTPKSSKQTLLVPYFEWRKRARTNTDASKLAAEKASSMKNHGKVKEKASHKKKTGTRAGKERDAYCNSYLHACESLLSIIVDRKQQEGKSVIISLKKTGPQLPQFLTQCSASIAGTGIAVVLSVLCRIACGRVPFCGSKLLSTGVGLGLVWLSWAVNKLRNTVVSISKSSGRDEEMMDNLDRNLKDIYFRAAALMAVAVLRLA